MNRGTDRDISQRQCVAGPNRCFVATHQLHADRYTFGRDDVTTLAVGVNQQRDVRGAVRIVFEPFNLRTDAFLIALEIDQAIRLLMAAALVPNRDPTRVVATRPADLGFGQRCERLAFVQMCADNLYDSTPTGRCWFDLYECHYLTSCAKSISCPGFNRIYALRTLLRRPSNRPKRFCLPF